MRSFWLNKLVRDDIFRSMQRLGHKVKYRTLDDEELLSELKKKLLEEAAEFDPANADAVEELADLLEVIEEIGSGLGKDFAELRTQQRAKRKKWGGFKKRIYVECLELSEDDPWAAYYAADPERFPEKK